MRRISCFLLGFLPAPAILRAISAAPPAEPCALRKPPQSGTMGAMADPSDWAFPEKLQPRAEELRFDLPAALDSLVLLRAEIPEDAFTASILGTDRVGNGV